ncbi:hypothetical protein MHY1_02170 [Methylovirgula sp. HY1]|nr:hypothetical protein MHY1_02170 [Methylovirgula sp. HY1]
MASSILWLHRRLLAIRCHGNGRDIGRSNYLDAAKMNVIDNLLRDPSLFCHRTDEVLRKWSLWTIDSHFMKLAVDCSNPILVGCSGFFLSFSKPERCEYRLELIACKGRMMSAHFLCSAIYWYQRHSLIIGSVRSSVVAIAPLEMAEKPCHGILHIHAKRSTSLQQLDGVLFIVSDESIVKITRYHILKLFSNSLFGLSLSS